MNGQEGTNEHDGSIGNEKKSLALSNRTSSAVKLYDARTLMYRVVLFENICRHGLTRYISSSLHRHNDLPGIGKRRRNSVNILINTR